MKRFVKYSLIALAVAFTLIALITVFGDNSRQLFGMSADALAGNHEPGRDRRNENKKLRNYAETDYAESVYQGIPSQVTAAPTLPVPLPNKTEDARVDNFSTFAIDVDRASYTAARKSMVDGYLPQPASIRVEEWINAFEYSAPSPTHEPFYISLEAAPFPLADGKHLMKVTLKGREVTNAQRKPTHLVFLVDTSGSMSSAEKLPWVQKSMLTVLGKLNAHDTVSIVTYAGSTEVLLDAVSATEQTKIRSAVNGMRAGGGTAMASGMELAYKQAAKTVKRGSVSRVMVMTDGDANIGSQNPDDMLKAIRNHVNDGVTMTTVGFGMGNYRADALEKLADSGDGQALYIDSEKEIEEVFSKRISSTLEFIAKDVKVQVEFNASVVKAYKLLGYENRAVADADFRNDNVDGGELGAGHTVTALYEIQLSGEVGRMATVHVRGLDLKNGQRFETKQDLSTMQMSSSFESASADLRFATAVGLAADVLRGNKSAEWNLATIKDIAHQSTMGHEDRIEFVRLLDRATELQLSSSREVTRGGVGHAGPN
jgi:Ca-activated chloride channel homolog